MPAPEKILATVRRATMLTAATPGRRGALLALDRATEVVVAGDLHGHVANFKSILQHANLAAHPGRHLVLQELIHSSFPYPQGGEKSHQLVDLYAALKCQYPDRVHYLPGNHELAQFTNRPIGKGDTTYNAEFRHGVEAAYGLSAAKEIYDAYMDLIGKLPLAIRTGNRVFLSHSLPAAKHLAVFDAGIFERSSFKPEDYLPGGSIYAVVWGRDTSQSTVNEYLKRVDADLLITGHIPLETGFQAPNDNQLIVDCSTFPAAVCTFPADKPIRHADLLAGVTVFGAGQS
jgi:hypothetical protein